MDNPAGEEKPTSKAGESEFQIPPSKRLKMESAGNSGDVSSGQDERAKKGVAPIKAEFLLPKHSTAAPTSSVPDDDDAEAAHNRQTQNPSASTSSPRDANAMDWKRDGKRDDKRRKNKPHGQNKNRQFGHWGDNLQLCNSRAFSDEFSPSECSFGDRCRMVHDLRKYLAEGKAQDLTTFDGVCPVWDKHGFCTAGWKCRFVGSHSKEVERDDGRKELVLVRSDDQDGLVVSSKGRQTDLGVVNVIDYNDRVDLSRKRFKTPKSDAYAEWLHKDWNPGEGRKHNALRAQREVDARGTGDGVKNDATNYGEPDGNANNPDEDVKVASTEGALKNNGDVSKAANQDQNGTKVEAGGAPVKEEISMKEETSGMVETADATVDPVAGQTTTQGNGIGNANGKVTEAETKEESAENVDRNDNRAGYVEPPFRPSEKRRLYYGPETPILAPLTTQGNLPFRRLCVELGAQFTWSEMAMGLSVVQGLKSEWSLLKAHQSEMEPPTVKATIADYDNSKDFKFGAQIAANKPWIALKTTEVLTELCPRLRAIDLNCGCPIDLVYKEGGGSALLDNPSRLEKMVRGMNSLSGEIPITVKIRMGTRDNRPNADTIVNRLLLGGMSAQQAGLGPAGVAAITLHGRSRQQRYTRQADWGYISDIAALIKRINADMNKAADTAMHPDERNQPNAAKTYFVGNGDCFSHVDYFEHLEKDKVDSVMIGRGALIKPWIFEEIASGQYLDKSASERLEYISRFVKHGLETWGSDEMGVGTTRKFLLEWLSFSCRYVPLGILEHLPPRINERPPPYKGRNELESLLASENYRDWIKISEMFLGPAHKDFRFVPKHKSNAYDLEAEG